MNMIKHMTKQKYYEIMSYSGKVCMVSNQLNSLIQKAYKLKYNPIVKIRKHSGNIPYVDITFFPPNDKNNLTYKKGQKCY
jgi:hypothetical protein